MEHANFKQKLRSGTPLIGTIVSLATPAVTECLSRIGFDWLWLDMEHAPLSLENIQSMLTAKDPICGGLVRIPKNDDKWIKRVLDIGAEGIIVPHVSSVDEVRKAISSAKYPPAGSRSFGAGRAHLYGIDPTYQQRANDSIVVVVQIEDKDAVKNIDAILSVEGLDAIIIGPYDLSGSFSKLGEVGDSEVQDAIQKVVRACKKHSVPAGIFALHTEQANRYIDQGFTLVAVGVDIHTLWTAAKDKLKDVTTTRSLA